MKEKKLSKPTKSQTPSLTESDHYIFGVYHKLLVDGESRIVVYAKKGSELSKYERGCLLKTLI